MVGTVRSILLFLAALLCASAAHGAQAGAQPGAVSGLTFSAFGTFGAVVTDNDEVRFHSSTRQARGAGTSPSLGVDSRLGLQANATLNSTFSAVGQLLVSRRDDGLKAQAEWLYGQAEVAPWLKLRVGRMVLPVFLVSDSRNVGYATHWVRAPSEVYGLYPASAFDGGQAQFQSDWGNTHITLQASVGTSKVDVYAFGSRSSEDLKNLYSLNLVVERGNWTFRLGDTEGRNTEISGPSVSLPAYTDSFRGAGIAYDDGKTLVQAEYVIRRTSNDSALDMDGYYVTAGYRLGAWTPYVTYSHYEPKGTLLTGLPSTRTMAAGLRWDAMRNVAVKTQIESTQNNGLNFINPGPESVPLARKVNMFTLLVDFVF
jgi:hypothetical protein